MPRSLVELYEKCRSKGRMACVHVEHFEHRDKCNFVD
jgi:hypothetical protein